MKSLKKKKNYPIKHSCVGKQICKHLSCHCWNLHNCILFSEHTTIDTKQNEITTEHMKTMYTKEPINSPSMFSIKDTFFKIGTPALGIVLIAYITVWVIDKRRKKTLWGFRNQDIQLLWFWILDKQLNVLSIHMLIFNGIFNFIKCSSMFVKQDLVMCGF